MKFFFDARYIRTDYHDGISRYSTELGNALAKLTPVTFLICDDAQLAFLPKKSKHIKIHRPTSILEPFTALILNKYAPDVVYSPLQVLGGFGRKFKLILTVQDFTYYRQRTPPHNLPAPVRLVWWLYHSTFAFERFVLKQADVVGTISETVQQQIRQYKMTKRPIAVVFNAPQQLETHLEKPVKNGTPKNIIYMGSFMPYKNAETLIKGMEWLPDKTLHLLSRISDQRRQTLEALKPTNAHIIFHNGVSDKEYAELLADNAILATASLEEGYGLPIVEAAALGVPTVISDIPIFHEVGADGALYFNPQDPKAFAKQVSQLDDPKVRAALTHKGGTHAASYSWSSSAQTLLNAAESLV